MFFINNICIQIQQRKSVIIVKASIQQYFKHPSRYFCMAVKRKLLSDIAGFIREDSERPTIQLHKAERYMFRVQATAHLNLYFGKYMGKANLSEHRGILYVLFLGSWKLAPVGKKKTSVPDRLKQTTQTTSLVCFATERIYLEKLYTSIIEYEW